MQRQTTTPPRSIRGGEIHSGGHRSIPISWASSGFNNANPTQHYHIQTGGSYGKHNANMPPVLDYAASQEDAIVTYRASDMKLAIHSNTSYLSKPKARSRASGHMFMAGTEEIPINNGAVLHILQIIEAVMSLAAEAKLGALFINTKTTVSIQMTLKEMGHSQSCTPIQTNNLTAHTLLTNKILPKALKAMVMRFHLLRCRSAQNQYRYYWRPGTQNLADYWTKHHPAKHHNFFGHKF
jgi:hypothetical protein